MIEIEALVSGVFDGDVTMNSKSAKKNNLRKFSKSILNGIHNHLNV